MPDKIEQMSTKEVYAALGDRSKALELVTDAYSDGLTLSRHLERVSPTDPDDKSGLDAFGRLMKEAGIVTRSDPGAGYWSSPVKDFFTSPANRILFSEFFARTYRKTAYTDKRAIYLSGDGVPGSWQRPYFDAQEGRWDFQLAPAIPLSELIATTTPIEGADYRSFYMTYDAEQLRQFRVGESAEIPKAKLQDSERIIQLQKYGRAIDASYEQIRRMRVDKLAMVITNMAVQAEVDKVAAGLDVLINGDGNTGTVPVTWDLNGDFGGVLGTLDLNSWLWFKKKFVQPYSLTTALMQDVVALQLEQLTTGSANVALITAQINGAGAVTPINTTSDGVRYGWTSDAPALVIVGFDRTRAMEQVVEIGGAIDEMEKFISNQTQLITMTEVMFFAIMDGNATKLLDIND